MPIHFTTPKGSKLPLLDMRGKDYLQVAHRLVWFREEHPDWGIETEIAKLVEKAAIFRATIRDAGGRIIAQGTKHETQAGFADYLEKAETGAIGRALAMCGYGTQFCADELDEGERLADSPVPKPVTQEWSGSDAPPATHSGMAGVAPERADWSGKSSTPPAGNGKVASKGQIGFLWSLARSKLGATTTAEIKAALRTRFGIESVDGLPMSKAKEAIDAMVAMPPFTGEPVAAVVESDEPPPPTDADWDFGRDQ